MKAKWLGNYLAQSQICMTMVLTAAVTFLQGLLRCDFNLLYENHNLCLIFSAVRKLDFGKHNLLLIVTSHCKTHQLSGLPSSDNKLLLNQCLLSTPFGNRCTPIYGHVFLEYSPYIVLEK